MCSASTTRSSSETSCKKVKKLLEEADKVTLVHHWDADGIFSAAIIKRALPGKDVVTVVPEIGEYSAEAIPSIDGRVGQNTVVLVDYGISFEEVQKLSRAIGRPVAVIDHHASNVSGEYVCNPVAAGMHEEDYPSTTWVIKQQILGKDLINDPEIGLMIAAGIIGDVGPRAKNLPQWVFIESVLKEAGLNLNDLARAIDIVDSCYRLYDKECIRLAVEAASSGGVPAVLNHPTLIEKNRVLADEMKKVFEHVQEVSRMGDIIMYRLVGDLYVTSYVGRKLAGENPYHVVVLVHEVPRLGKIYVYVRSATKYLRPCIKLLKQEGLVVGGKDRVFVVTCTADCSQAIIQKVIDALREVCAR